MILERVAALPIIAALVWAGTAASPASAAGPVGQLTLTLANANTGAVMAMVTLTCELPGATRRRRRPAMT